MRLIACLVVFCSPAIALATEVKLSIPLQDGRLNVLELRNTLQSDLHLSQKTADHLPDLNVSLNVRSIDGWLLLHAVNAALGDGFHLAADNDALRISVDTQKLPADWDESCEALERFTRVAAPEATARQARRFGLHLPQNVDEKTPLVVLIHGLDGDEESCCDLASLLQRDGFQTATFAYPAERPISENAALFARHMSALRGSFPNLRIDLVTESMGGLIARRYVEGANYAGGIDHFILIAPPNEGSTWVGSGWILKLIVNAAAWKDDPQWSPTWMITEGICQEARDLRPESDFLENLNSQSRRAGIRYTIIAGDRSPIDRYEANLLAIPIAALSGSISDYWGFRQIEQAMLRQHQRLTSRTGSSDGPVTLTSAQLPGVTDFVTISADHVQLFKSIAGNLPAAWPTIHDRLATN